MANLVIDIGNTLTKIAAFKNDKLLHTGQYQTVNDDVLFGFIDKYQVNKAIISSVKKTAAPWQPWLLKQTEVVNFNPGMAGNIVNRYLTPQTLGADRLAGVIGAHYLYPDCNNIIIDGGTCITYDGVDTDGNYFGGSISPGLNMRYKALNYYTDGLPLVAADETFDLGYGNDTMSAIRSGVQNGIKFELTGFIESYKKNGETPNIILTGGDSIFFDTLLKNSIFARYIKKEPYLVLKGLNAAILNTDD